MLDIISARHAETRALVKQAEAVEVMERIFLPAFGSGFIELVVALLANEEELNALIIATATAHRENTEIVEIFATNSHEKNMKIQETFKNLMGYSLMYDLEERTSRNFRYLIDILVENTDRFEDNSVNFTSAKESALILYHTGRKHYHNIEPMIEIFVKNNRQQMLAIFDEFQKMFNYPVEKFIQDAWDLCMYPFFNFECDIQKALFQIIAISRNTTKYFAKRLHELFEGMRNHEDTTLHVVPGVILLARQYIDLKQIVAEYKEIYHKDVEDELIRIPEIALRDSYIALMKTVIDHAV